MIYYLLATLVIVVVFLGPSWWLFRREEAEARRLLAASEAAGTREPVTIQPWVDPSKCMGSGTCVAACPEKDVLKVIDGRATLVNGSVCVGHGACMAACPVGAIELRFGSERRGVDIPAVKPDFQSTVRGLYVAGELGGMGLIANAVRQGTQAVDNLAKGLPRPKADDVYDLVVVGAGPAGIGASLAAVRHGLRHVVLEQDVLGGAITHFPRRKIVMSHGLRFPGRRPTPRTLRKEELIELIQDLVAEHRLPVCEEEQVLGVEKIEDDLFEIRTPRRTLRATRVVLAVGRRGTPRKLGVPGEDLDKVAYRLLDPERITHSHVLVVGGGDSALEAACALAESPGNRVSLSYRRDTFTRAKPANRDALMAHVDAGRVVLHLNTNVVEIAPDRVVLTGPDGHTVLPNDLVYIFAGGVLPTQFLKNAGLTVERHFGGRVEVVA